MVISFKDVGVKEEERVTDVLATNRSKIPLGIKTPLELDTFGKEMFVMHLDAKDQINDNLKNLLLTNHGERVNQYSFGANLQPLAAEYANKDDFDTEAMLRINTAISKWMPFVVPVEFDSRIDRQGNAVVGRVILLVVYSVPALNISKNQLEIEISVV